MKALIQDRYGSPDVLRIAEVPTPSPGPGEVRVAVRAASVNAADWHLMRGEPRVVRHLDRTTFGSDGPRQRVRGMDFAGIVDAVGDDVTAWRAGDEVFGEAEGSLAEYVVAEEGVLAAKPARLPFEEAAAVPLAGNTALVCLRAGRLGAGQSVLVNGASGGVGTFAVQIAAAWGATVTAVCSARNAELVRSLGATHVVDYGRADFAASGERYDAVLDLVGNRSLRDLRRAVRRGGTLVLSGGGVSGEQGFLGPLRLMAAAKLVGRLSRLRVQVPLAKPDGAALAELSALIEAGSVRPVIDRTFAFADAAEAIRYLEVEHARAKVVVSVA